jgi:hypothetical protein
VRRDETMGLIKRKLKKITNDAVRRSQCQKYELAKLFDSLCGSALMQINVS